MMITLAAAATWACIASGLCVDIASLAIEGESIIGNLSVHGANPGVFYIQCDKGLSTAFDLDGNSTTSRFEANSVAQALCERFVWQREPAT